MAFKIRTIILSLQLHYEKEKKSTRCVAFQASERVKVLCVVRVISSERKEATLIKREKKFFE